MQLAICTNSAFPAPSSLSNTSMSMLVLSGEQLIKRFQAHLNAFGVATRKQLEIPIMEVSHYERSDRRSGAEPGGDVVSRDNVRLQVGREGEYGDPGGEDIGEGVHLVRGGVGQLTAIRRLKTAWGGKGGRGTNQCRGVCPLLRVVSGRLVHPCPSDTRACA